LAAIMNGDIKVNYTQDDQIHQLQAREMIDAMLEMNKDGASIWAYILDLQAEFFTFSDPYLLTSFIMVNGYTGSFDIREISDALIDDTLKSTLKLHQIFKQHIPRLLNPECFILQLNEIPLTHHFVPEFLINQVVDTHQQPSSKHHGFFHSFNHSNNAYSYYEQQVATAPACAP